MYALPARLGGRAYEGGPARALAKGQKGTSDCFASASFDFYPTFYRDDDAKLIPSSFPNNVPFKNNTRDKIAHPLQRFPKLIFPATGRASANAEHV